MRVIIAAGALALMTGCASIPVAIQAVGAGAAIARSAYCIGISEAGKEKVRDVVTAGEQVIVCEGGDD